MSCPLSKYERIGYSTTTLPTNMNDEIKSKKKRKIVFPKDSDPSVKAALSALTDKSFKHNTKPLIVFKFELSTNKKRQLFGIFDSLNNFYRPTKIRFTHIWNVHDTLDEYTPLPCRIKLSDIKHIEVSKVHTVVCRWLNKKKLPNKPWLVTLQSTSGESTTGLLTTGQIQDQNLIPSVSLQSDPNELSTISTTTIDKIASLKRLQPKTAFNAYKKDRLCPYGDPPKIIQIISGFQETTALWGKFFYEKAVD
jgi:hypothetical protein